MSPVLLIASLLFAIVILFFVIYSFFLVYHLFEFSLNRGSAFILIAVFSGVSVVLLFTILIFLAQVDWNAPLFTFLQ
jgi:hypothetical protein